jgi:hypothetical protein
MQMRPMTMARVLCSMSAVFAEVLDFPVVSVTAMVISWTNVACAAVMAFRKEHAIAMEHIQNQAMTAMTIA